MNKIILIGRLTADPELRFTPNGAAVTTFTLAVDRPYNPNKEERGTDFIEVVVWNKTAENVAKYLTKGRQAAVEGRLQIRSYDGKDGQRHWRTQVVANSVEFLGNNSSSGNNSASTHSQYQQNQSSQASNNNQNNSFDEFAEISFSGDEDLPF